MQFSTDINSAVHPSAAPAPGRPQLDVPASFRKRYDAAIATGRMLGEQLAAQGPAGGAAFNRFLHEQVGASVVKAPVAGTVFELVDLHRIEGLRTEAGSSAAVWHARFGANRLWDAPTRDLLARLPAADALRAAALLGQAHRISFDVSDGAKRTYLRPRPYETDPTLTTVVPRPINNSSWPSGHASAAAVMGVLLASRMPERAASLLSDAAEVAWSRVYGGVHFPSDVLEGARIGAAIAAALAARIR